MFFYCAIAIQCFFKFSKCMFCIKKNWVFKFLYFLLSLALVFLSFSVTLSLSNKTNSHLTLPLHAWQIYLSFIYSERLIFWEKSNLIWHYQKSTLNPNQKYMYFHSLSLIIWIGWLKWYLRITQKTLSQNMIGKNTFLLQFDFSLIVIFQLTYG